MSNNPTPGRRVYPDTDGNLTLAAGDYGCNGGGRWFVRPPGCHTGAIPHHKVEEHEDKTVTVEPSIAYRDGRGTAWHGYLRRGKWVTA